MNIKKKTLDFLKECNATIEIKPIGEQQPLWDDNPHKIYLCTVKTPLSQMEVIFYDSLYNTEILNMSVETFYEKQTHRKCEGVSYGDKIKYQKLLKQKQKEAIPTEYDIIACIEKYSVGNLDDFISEFGYKIKTTKDFANILNIYNEIIKQYNDLRRCFTKEQIEKMQEIF